MNNPLKPTFNRFLKSMKNIGLVGVFLKLYKKLN